MKIIKKYETKSHPEIDEKFHQFEIGNIGNTIYWWKFFEMVKDIPGDIVECGIGRARSLIIISALNFLLEKEEGGQRTIYGYDSFEEGFPEPSKEDMNFRKPKKGEWSKSPSGKYDYTENFIKNVIKEAGIPINEIDLVLKKGFFDKTLKTHPKNPIAILHVDGDLYESYKSTLENLYDKVSPGGIIVFDDIKYFESNENELFPGARLAVEEFFNKDISEFKKAITGNYYHIK